MKRYLIFAAYLPALVAQASVLPLLKLGGGEVNLILVLNVLAGLMAGPDIGAAAGFWGGLLVDLVTGRFLGLHALVGMATGYLAGAAGNRVYRNHFPVPSLVAAGGALFQETMIWGFLRVFGLAVDPLGILRIALPEALLAAVVIVPLAAWWGRFRREESDLRTAKF